MAAKRPGLLSGDGDGFKDRDAEEWRDTDEQIGELQYPWMHNPNIKGGGVVENNAKFGVLDQNLRNRNEFV